MRNFNIVVAANERMGIGKNGTIPWKLSGDMRWFKELTSSCFRKEIEKSYGLREIEVDHKEWGMSKPNVTVRNPIVNAVIMGRKTWESIPDRYRPLQNRLNIVISSKQIPNVITYGSLDEALLELSKDLDVCEVFVIGGAMLYEAAIKHPFCSGIYITTVSLNGDCDTFFPSIPDNFVTTLRSPMVKENLERYRVEYYKNKNLP